MTMTMPVTMTVMGSSTGAITVQTMPTTTKRTAITMALAMPVMRRWISIAIATGRLTATITVQTLGTTKRTVITRPRALSTQSGDWPQSLRRCPRGNIHRTGSSRASMDRSEISWPVHTRAGDPGHRARRCRPGGVGDHDCGTAGAPCGISLAGRRRH